MSRNWTGPAKALSPHQRPPRAVFLTARPLDAPWIPFPTPAANAAPGAATSNLTANLATSATGSARALFLPSVVPERAAVVARLPGARGALTRVALKMAPDPRAVNSNVPPLRPNLTTPGDRGCVPTRSPATLPRPLLLLPLRRLLRPPLVVPS